MTLVFILLFISREQIAMSRGLTDVPMVVVANKTDLIPGDRQASDKFRHDIINKVKKWGLEKKNFVRYVSIIQQFQSWMNRLDLHLYYFVCQYIAIWKINPILNQPIWV